MQKDEYELVGDGEIKPDPRWRMAPHFHSSHHELILVLGGSLHLKTPDTELFAGPGDVLFYERGMIHEEISQPKNPVHLLFIAFRCDATPALPLKLRDAEGRLRELFSWLIRDRRRGRPIPDCIPFLKAILSEVQWNVNAHNPWLESRFAYLRQNFARKLSLAALAREADMSRFAFIRKFKRLTGHTPMDELRRIRLNEARNMILSSNLPLKSIAPATGLGDEYQLSKLFRRYFGLSSRGIRAPKTDGRRTSSVVPNQDRS